MKNREVAIVKNGFDIARIIEFNSDSNTCEFKIVPMVGNSNLEIKYLKMFSPIKTLKYDKSSFVEFTYHKALGQKPTKIHLKLSEHNHMPILKNNLIDPNINTEIPIPLFKMTIPDECLTKKYVFKPHHKVFDIGDNNIIEIFLTSTDYRDKNYFSKWEHLMILLFSHSIEYFSTGLDEFVGRNIRFSLENSSKLKKPILVNLCANVTNDIGTMLNINRDSNLVDKNSSILFIENKYYLAFLGGVFEKRMDGNNKRAYMYDSCKFDFIERAKWDKIFISECDKLDKLIRFSNGKYEEQFKKYN